MISQGKTEKNPNTLLMSPEFKSVQNLMPMSEADRSNLKDDIAKNGMRHPVIAYRKEGGYYILAGWNRREIAIELNIPLVEVQIIEGKPEKYKSFVITENLSRRHLTAEQKRELIKYLLKEDSEQSSRAIAKKTGTHHSTVERVRGKSGGEISHLRKGQDGKDYKQPVKPLQSARDSSGKIAKVNLEANYETQYFKLLKVIDTFIKKHPKVSGIMFLKEEIEKIRKLF